MSNRCLLLLCLFVAYTRSEKESLQERERLIVAEDDIVFAEGGGFGSGSGSGMPMLSINTSEFSLPVCMADELLVFDGNSLLCNKIPERKCICPGPILGSGELPTQPLEPPGGCLIFDPPEGGAFVCLRIDEDNVIYCSVYCDNEHEFSTTPLNPYFCGVETKLEWKDFTGTIHQELPECTGFRHSLRPLHPLEFYIPQPCNVLFSDQADVDKIRSDFCKLTSFFSRKECDASAVSIQCPQTAAVTTTQMPAAHNPQLNP